jgi:hypothetical protein
MIARYRIAPPIPWRARRLTALTVNPLLVFHVTVYRD